MIKLKSTLLMMLIFGQLCFAQNNNSLLYQISGEGIERPSYLFGTVHILCPEDFEMKPAVVKAFDETERVVLELDMDDPVFMQKMQQLSINPDANNISDKFSAEELAKLDTFLIKNYGVGMQQLGVIKPFILISMMLPKYLDCPQPASFEMEFVKMAQKGEKPVEGLETPDFQMAIFDNIPLEEQIDWINEMLENPEKTKEGFTKMMEAYKSNDIDRLHAVMLENPQYDEHMDALLYNRNKTWETDIINLVKEKPTFIAVGAGHLGSDRGVVALLRARGYQLEPVF